jgi:hypothetical protein
MPNRIENPHFRPPPAGLRAEWASMRASPTGLPRPLVVFSGWRAPRLPVMLLASRLRSLTGAPKGLVVTVGFVLCGTFGAATRRAVAKVERRWPSADPGLTAEVDVVGISMGGLVARAAAVPDGGGRQRLRIARLFTLATPHRGATLARRVCLDGTSRDMRPGCDFLRRLQEAPRDYELVCYARLRDWWVGARNAAPPGEDPIWTDAPGLLSHQAISTDRLIGTDLARRLRGEEPLGHPSPPPRD